MTSPPDYAGAFKRRFAIDPSRVALLIIDVQYASGSRTQGLGARLADEGRDTVGRWRFDRIEQVVLPNLGRLLALFRQRGLPVVYVALGSKTGDFTDVPPYLRPLVEGTDNHPDSPTHAFLDEIAPRADDVVVEKTTASAFLSSDLHERLQQRGIRQLLLTGISTNSCVESTGRDGADLGYDCVLVEDCCSCAAEEYHWAAVRNFDRLFGQISTADETIAALGGGAGE